MDEDFVCTYIKYAHSEKEAISYIVQGKIDKSSWCTFKKGGSGQLIGIDAEPHAKL
jgi:hypothetical protein